MDNGNTENVSIDNYVIYLDTLIQSYTLRNEGSLAALKEPLWFFCETMGSFDGVGFF